MFFFLVESSVYRCGTKSSTCDVESLGLDDISVASSDHVFLGEQQKHLSCVASGFGYHGIIGLCNGGTG